MGKRKGSRPSVTLGGGKGGKTIALLREKGKDGGLLKKGGRRGGNIRRPEKREEKKERLPFCKKKWNGTELSMPVEIKKGRNVGTLEERKRGTSTSDGGKKKRAGESLFIGGKKGRRQFVLEKAATPCKKKRWGEAIRIQRLPGGKKKKKKAISSK